MERAISTHSISQARPSKNTTTRKKVSRRRSESKLYDSEDEDTDDCDPAKMYLTYQDAVLATLKNNVNEEPVLVTNLVENLQELMYFDQQKQEYVHPQSITDQQFVFMVQRNPAIRKYYSVNNDYVTKAKNS